MDSEITVQLPEELNKLCRTCLSAIESDQPNKLFDFDKHSDVATMLNYLTALEPAPDDGLPASLCDGCVSNLKQACEFKEQCEKNYLSLCELLGLTKTTTTEAEIIDVPEETQPSEDASLFEHDLGTEGRLELFEDVMPKGVVLYMDGQDYEADIIDENDDIGMLIEERKTVNDEPVCNVSLGAVSDQKEQMDNVLPTSQGETDSLFKCDLCGKTFVKDSGLASHFLKHVKSYARDLGITVEILEDSEMYYTCFTCESTNFNTIHDLSEHLIRNHSLESTYSCELCGFESTKYCSLICHLTEHNIEKFECDICFKYFDSLSEFKEHYANHQFLDENHDYHCPLCTGCFESSQILKYHALIHLNETFTCEQCNKSFNNFVTFDFHKKTHNEKFLCSVCGKQFSSNTVLLTHLVKHNNDKPFVCQQCNKRFSSRSALSVHKRIHSSFKPYVCCYCGYTCRQSGDLSIHIRTHTGEKPYKCTFPNCNRSFTTGSQRQEHHRRHTNERNHSCNTCGKTFLESKTLKVHMLVHTNLRKYACEICGKTFKRQHHIVAHMRVHRDSV